MQSKLKESTFHHRILFYIVIPVFYLVFPTGFVIHAELGNGILTVTNSSDIVNGDTSSIIALQNNPGADGISFREALVAANNTLGTKLITFAPSLKGGAIQFAPGGGLLKLSSGDLTINGDVDGDGLPDITLDGSLGQSGSPSAPGLNIVSSNNKITKLILTKFHGPPIQHPCLPNASGPCGSMCFTNNKIIGNIISSPDGPSIMIYPCSLDLSTSPRMSDIIYRDVVIADNTISTKAVSQPSSAIYISPALGGGSRNKLINLTISGNNITVDGPDAAIDIIVADVNTTYFNIPGPIQYSNESIIENLTISNNKMSSEGSGIGIAVANFGNRNNQIKNLRIDGNTIAAKYLGIHVSCGDGQGGLSSRATSDNLISNLVIRRNTIIKAGIGIGVRAGDGTDDSPNPVHNRIENVVVQGNTIDDFNGVGIELIGGQIATRGVVAQTTISENVISQKEYQKSGIGIHIVGGLDSSVQNQLQDVFIRDNQISYTESAIRFVGGSGIEAQSNRVFIREIQRNLLSNNRNSISVVDNAESAKDNRIFIYPDAPLVDSDMDGVSDAVDPDDDDDGMPDEWEMKYSLHQFINDASVDSDRDGYTNLEEYEAGTNPMDKYSRSNLRDMPWIPLLLSDE